MKSFPIRNEAHSMEDKHALPTISALRPNSEPSRGTSRHNSVPSHGRFIHAEAAERRAAGFKMLPHQNFAQQLQSPDSRNYPARQRNPELAQPEFWAAASDRA